MLLYFSGISFPIYLLGMFLVYSFLHAFLYSSHHFVLSLYVLTALTMCVICGTIIATSFGISKFHLIVFLSIELTLNADFLTFLAVSFHVS
jgi:hypothetical protein